MVDGDFVLLRERVARCEECCSDLRVRVGELRGELDDLEDEFHLWIRVLVMALVGCVLAAVFEAMI